MVRGDTNHGRLPRFVSPRNGIMVNSNIVFRKPLSEQHKRILKAATITHSATGLTICSHADLAIPAFKESDISKEDGIQPSPFVRAHAQMEKDKIVHQRAAAIKSWISLNGIGLGDVYDYADSSIKLKDAGLLDKVLISHDTGWYSPMNRMGSLLDTEIFSPTSLYC